MNKLLLLLLLLLSIENSKCFNQQFVLLNINAELKSTCLGLTLSMLVQKGQHVSAQHTHTYTEEKRDRDRERKRVRQRQTLLKTPPMPIGQTLNGSWNLGHFSS